MGLVRRVGRNGATRLQDPFVHLDVRLECDLNYVVHAFRCHLEKALNDFVPV